MTDKELQENYPAYFKSIFSDFKPDNAEILGWKQNVLQKIKGYSILPHYIKKDKDFDIFWGWIIHFFAIIVYFGRNLKKFFNNYENYLDEIGEFMREKDYIKDSRVQINKDLKIPLIGQAHYKIFCNCDLIKGIETIVSRDNYVTDYIAVKDCSVISLKVLGYNYSINEYNKGNIDWVKICFYSLNKEYINEIIINGLENNGITDWRVEDGYKVKLTTKEAYYIRISYPSIIGSSSSIPLYLGVSLEREGSIFGINRTEENIFNIYSDFRRRGTFKSSNLIKKILESKEEEGFYADYLSQQNTGWFLNRNSPIFQELSNKIKIDNFIFDENNKPTNDVQGNLIIPIQEQYAILNQNTSIIIKWRGSEAKRDLGVAISISVFDKDKNLLNIPPLSYWKLDNSKHIYEGSISVSYADVKYDRVENLNVAEFPINIIDNYKSATLSSDTYYLKMKNGENHTIIYPKRNNSGTKEAYYLRIDSVRIVKNLDSIENVYIKDNDYLNNFNIGLYLRKLPITLGFLNNKQYYICCFKNNGSYSNKEAKDIIDQKILPYNGYRIFIDNSYYKNNINIALSLKHIYFNKIDKNIYLEIRGGVPPYNYKYDNSISENSYLSNYKKRAEYGFHTIEVTDSLGNTILTEVSCQPYNLLDYKFKLYVGKDNSLQVFIKLFGGTESSYSIIQDYSSLLYDKDGNLLLDKDKTVLRVRDKSGTKNPKQKIISANVWVDITDLVGNNFDEISDDISLYIRDNGFPIDNEELRNEYKDLILPLQDLFKDFALDFYDNGKGKLVN